MAKKIPLELQLEKEKTNRELWRESISTARQTAVVLVNSPVFQMIAALVAVELIQKIKIDDKPLVSDTLANTMTGVVVAKGAVSSVSDLIGLINPFD